MNLTSSECMFESSCMSVFLLCTLYNKSDLFLLQSYGAPPNRRKREILDMEEQLTFDQEAEVNMPEQYVSTRTAEVGSLPLFWRKRRMFELKLISVWLNISYFSNFHYWKKLEHALEDSTVNIVCWHRYFTAPPANLCQFLDPW